MATTVTVKRQVTLPKSVRDAVGIKPGDRVEVRATAAGGVIIEKAGAADEYLARLYAIAKRRPLRGITTDELMKMSRGDPGEDPALKE
jgi:antitoxin PrlF